MRYSSWQDYAAERLDPDVVIKRLVDTPNPVAKQPIRDRLLLRRHLESLFIPCNADIDLASLVMRQISSAFALRYTDRREYLKRINSPVDAEGSSGMEPMLVTGLAGTGKTELFRRLAHILGESFELWLGDDYAGLQVGGVWTAECEPGMRPLGLLERIAQAAPRSEEPRQRRALQKHLRRAAYRDGLAALIVDELQFVAYSSSASSSAVAIVEAACALGLPTIVVSNFDMMLKFEGLSQQLTQRLLPNVHAVWPRHPGLGEWDEYVAEVVATMPRTIHEECVEQSSELWKLCAGLPRLFKHLLLCAFDQLPRKASSPIRWEHIVAGVRSEAYISSLEDAQEVVQLLCTGQCNSIRVPRTVSVPAFVGPAPHDDSAQAEPSVWHLMLGNTTREEQRGVRSAQTLREFDERMAARGKRPRDLNNKDTAAGLLKGLELAGKR